MLVLRLNPERDAGVKPSMKRQLQLVVLKTKMMTFKDRNP
jgi:hypothetical protein